MFLLYLEIRTNRVRINEFLLYHKIQIDNIFQKSVSLKREDGRKKQKAAELVQMLVMLPLVVLWNMDNQHGCNELIFLSR